MKKNTAGQIIGAQMITASDGSAFTGAVTCSYTIDGGTQTAGATVTHEGNGFHTMPVSATLSNGDHIGFTFIGTGAIPTTIQVYTSFPQTVDNDTKISLIPTTAMRGTDSAATSAKQNTMETTLNAIPTTPMRGTDSANTVAPDNASILAILADTNELQTNQGNWSTATGFNVGKTGYTLTVQDWNTVTPDIAGTAPTAAEINAEFIAVLETNTYPEPTSAVSATSSIKDAIIWNKTVSRNKMTQTSTTTLLRNDADSATISTSTVSDDGTTFIKGKHL